MNYSNSRYLKGNPKIIKIILAIIIICSTIYLLSFNHVGLNLLKNKRNLIQEGEINKYHKFKVVFIGDQYFYNWMYRDKEYFSDENTKNKGRINDTTLDMLNRFERDVISQEPLSVIIMGGANDLAEIDGKQKIMEEDTLNNLRLMLKMAKNHYIKPFLCSLIPASRIPYSTVEEIDIPYNIYIFNKKLKTLANEENVSFIDFYTKMRGKHFGLNPEYTFDGYNLNFQGFKKLEEIFFFETEKEL